jgi:hypothetical protein
MAANPAKGLAAILVLEAPPRRVLHERKALRR